MDGLDETITDDFVKEYEGIKKRYVELRAFGKNYIETLLNENRYEEAFRFIHRSDFQLPLDIFLSLLETGYLPILQYLHSKNPFQPEACIVKVTIENVSWCLSIGFTPDRLFLLAAKQNNIPVMEYLLSSFTINRKIILTDFQDIDDSLDTLIFLQKNNKLLLIGLYGYIICQKVKSDSVMRWIYQHASESTRRAASDVIINTKNLEMLKWVVQKYPESIDQLHYVTLGQMDKLQLLHEAGFRFSDHIRANADQEIREWFDRTYN